MRGRTLIASFLHIYRFLRTSFALNAVTAWRLPVIKCKFAPRCHNPIFGISHCVLMEQGRFT